jgi:thiol-disulfide isomerase/thioredoxin
MVTVIPVIVVLVLGSAGVQAPLADRLPSGFPSQGGDGRGPHERPSTTSVASGRATEEADARHDEVAAALEQFSATDLSGRHWTSANLRGRVVLLDFWATWCAPCLADLPLLQTLRQKHSRTDFEIVGISLDATSRRSLVSWLNRHRIAWPQVHERAGYSAGLPRLFGIEQLPSTVVVGRDGRPVAIDVRGQRLITLIDALVAEAPAARAVLRR